MPVHKGQERTQRTGKDNLFNFGSTFCLTITTMPTLKICQLLHQVKKDATAEIKIRVTHNRKIYYIRTGYYVKPAQLKNEMVVKHPEATLLNIKLEKQKSEVLNKILRQDLSSEGLNIGKALGKDTESTETMFGAIKHVMRMYEAQNMPASFNRMQTNLTYIQEAWQKDKFLTDVTKIDVEKFANWRYQKGNTASTVKKNLSDLAAVLNHIDYKGVNHFSDYAAKIKAKPVQREKLTADEIKALENVQLKGMADIARDMFLFSFYTHGSRFESVATFKREYIRNDKIFYKMNKGEKFKELEIHPKLKLIIDKYINAQTLYLFPVVKEVHNDWNKKEIIGRANALIRNFLIYAAQQAGIEHHVHFHMSRHSAGYLALCAGVSMEIIKDAYGHSTYKVTEGYLKSLSDDIVNKEFNKIYE